MASKNHNDVKTDPSTVKQHFTNINLNVHCCRYWKLSEWEFRDLSLPFWRLYANSVPGASVRFGGRVYTLTAETVLLIPPFTSFSTSLKKTTDERFSGKRIENREELARLEKRGMVDHLFIHFNLGFRFDRLHPGIYSYKTEGAPGELLENLRSSLISEHRALSVRQNLWIHALILLLVSRIPEDDWKGIDTDRRVLRVIDYIEQHPHESLSNNRLAPLANMAVTSFLRLFKASTGSPLQQFVQAKRIEKALVMMHNPSLSIEQIAGECGFSDRQHFSKVFKRVVNRSPAQYRREQAM